MFVKFENEDTNQFRIINEAYILQIIEGKRVNTIVYINKNYSINACETIFEYTRSIEIKLFMINESLQERRK